MPKQDHSQPHSRRLPAPALPFDHWARMAWYRRREWEGPELAEAMREEVQAVRTDLALEAHALAMAEREIPGAKVETSEPNEFCKVTRMQIVSPDASRLLGKLPGHYTTIEAPVLRTHQRQAHQQVSQVLADELEPYLRRIPQDGLVLLVGLGNWNATPDALGPRVIHYSLVTRHLQNVVSEELREGLRPVAALSPGVMGITGMETGEIVHALVRQIHPAMVIAIDALAARDVERIGSNIQISDAGISPGSGVGNLRRGISSDALGIPTLAVGVPTVVHALAIVSDALDYYWQTVAREELETRKQCSGSDGRGSAPQADSGASGQSRGDASSAEPDSPQAGFPGSIDPDRILHPEQHPEPPPPPPHSWQVSPGNKQRVLDEVLAPYLGPLVVTPKEIDVIIEDVARVVAGGLNAALHPGVDLSDAYLYLQ